MLPTTADTAQPLLSAALAEEPSCVLPFSCRDDEERVLFRRWARLQDYEDLANLLLKHKFTGVGGDTAGVFIFPS